MNNDSAILLLLADKQRDVEALRAECTAMAEKLESLSEENRQLTEALNEARGTGRDATGETPQS